MKASQHLLGTFTKDGVRYRLSPEPGDTVSISEYAAANGYERAAPLTGEALQAAIAAQREADIARITTDRAARRAALPRPVPATVPLWALRDVLLEDDLLSTTLTAVADNPRLTNFLEYGNFVDRSSPALAVLAAQLGKSDVEVDELFRRAANRKI